MLYSFYKRYNESAMWCLNPIQMCNLSTLFQTRKLESILSKYDDNMAVSGGVSTCLILAYSILIAVGSGGNLMVLTAVAANKCKYTTQYISE